METSANTAALTPLLPALTPDQPFWLTRDRFEGELSPEVDVWVHQPIAEMFPDGDVLWLAPVGVADRSATYCSSIPAYLVRPILNCVAPDDPRQCIRVGRARG